MQGYKISQLNHSTKKIIKEQNIDKNNDGLINEKNGELSKLLSNTNATCIQELARFDKDRLANSLIGCNIIGLGTIFGVTAKEKYLSKPEVYALRSKAIIPLFAAAMAIPAVIWFFDAHPEKRSNLKLTGYEDKD